MLSVPIVVRSHAMFQPLFCSFFRSLILRRILNFALALSVAGQGRLAFAGDDPHAKAVKDVTAVRSRVNRPVFEV